MTESAFRALKIKINGTTPLLMHNERLANPFDPYTQLLMELNVQKKRKGTDTLEMLSKMSCAEWEGGLYIDGKDGPDSPAREGIGPYIPQKWIRANIREGAKQFRGGKTVTRSVLIPASHMRIPLEYDGPHDFQGLSEDERFWSRDMVKVGTAKVLRTRPIFPEWAATVEIHYNPNGISREDLVLYIESGGAMEGLGDGRTLGFGRFSVKVLKG